MDRTAPAGGQYSELAVQVAKCIADRVVCHALDTRTLPASQHALVYQETTFRLLFDLCARGRL